MVKPKRGATLKMTMFIKIMTCAWIMCGLVGGSAYALAHESVIPVHPTKAATNVGPKQATATQGAGSSLTSNVPEYSHVKEGKSPIDGGEQTRKVKVMQLGKTGISSAPTLKPRVNYQNNSLPTPTHSLTPNITDKPQLDGATGAGQVYSGFSSEIKWGNNTYVLPIAAEVIQPGEYLGLGFGNGDVQYIIYAVPGISTTKAVAVKVNLVGKNPYYLKAIRTKKLD